MVPATSRPAEVSWLDVMAQCARAECPAIGMAQRAPATPPARNPRRGLLSTTPPSRESPRRPESPSTHPICRTHPTPRTTRSRDTRETLDSRQSCATAACSWVSGRATKEQAELCYAGCRAAAQSAAAGGLAKGGSSCLSTSRPQNKIPSDFIFGTDYIDDMHTHKVCAPSSVPVSPLRTSLVGEGKSGLRPARRARAARLRGRRRGREQRHPVCSPLTRQDNTNDNGLSPNNFSNSPEGHIPVPIPYRDTP